MSEDAEIKTRVVYLRDHENHVVASVENGCLVLPTRNSRTRYVSFALTEICAMAEPAAAKNE